MYICVVQRWARFMGCLLGIVFFVVILLESAAFANIGWYNCSVAMAGPGDGGNTVVLLTHLDKNPDFEANKCFLFPADRAREMLAVALSAINSNKMVVVIVDIESGTYPVVSGILLHYLDVK